MVKWRLTYSKQARKDSLKAVSSGSKPKIESLLALIADDPFVPHPPYEKLSGDLAGYYSRRINIQHRLVYEVDEKEHIIKIFRLWSHYE